MIPPWAHQLGRKSIRSRWSDRWPMSGAGGFTLIEVMVSISILAIMGGLVVSTISNTLLARDMLADSDTVNQSARVALGRLSRELELAYLTSSTAAINTFRTIFIAEDDDPADRLWFTSLSHRRLYRDSRQCDQTEITVWAEDDPEDSSLMVLLHREAPRIDHEPDKDGLILPLAHGVKRFDLYFLDGKLNEWRDDWSTVGNETPERLPRAVKLVLVISKPDLDEPETLVDHTYVTTILLDYAEPMTKSLLGRGSFSEG